MKQLDSNEGQPGHGDIFIGGGLAAVSGQACGAARGARRIRLPRRRFRGRSRIPPGSPPTVNYITRCYPGGLQRDDIPVPEVLRAD